MARKGNVLTPPSVAVTTVATPPGTEAVGDVAAFNQASFSKPASDYLSLALEPAELWLLRQHRGDWHKLRMLDLGVGAGRTALTFAAVAGSYVGLDYVDEMVRLSRERVGEDENTRFMFRDARDLSCFREGEFDI